jgi:putative ABC transport system permease protein
VGLDEARRHRIAGQWRKAPFVLRHHPTVLAAVAAAAFLVALAAASSPFVRAAAGSVALNSKLDEFSPYTAGLEIQSFERRGRRAVPVEQRTRSADARIARIARMGRRIGSTAPPVTATLTRAISATAGENFTQIRLTARDGALGRLTVLSQAPGAGLWISDIAAGQLHVKAGDRFELTGSDFSGGGRDVPVRVKGIYRALAYQSAKPYWNNFLRDIYPSDLDSPPPPTFAFTDRRGIYALANRIGGATIESVYELPVEPGGLTLDDARALASRFAAVESALEGRTSLAAALRCTPEFRVTFVGSQSGCVVSSSLPSAIEIADSDVSAVAPVVRLLSGVGVAIALAMAAAAGVFAVRRRRVESALAFSRGEHVASFAGRTALEAVLATVAGGVLGFLAAWALTGTFAPHGTVTRTTFRAGAWQSAAAVAAGLALLASTAALAFVRLYDTGSRGRRRRPRWLVWELPLLVLAVLLLVRLERGGGFASGGASGSQHPTLAVFVFPLLLVAGASGLAVRAVRPLLRRSRGRGLPVPPYLALRRLGGARGLLVVLVVVSAVSFGALFYAETLAASLTTTTDVKAYTANGADVAAIVQSADDLPRDFPYPATTVQFGLGSASANTVIGDKLDVLVVDPKALPGVLRWQGTWGPSPAGLLQRLAGSPGTPLPLIATESAPPLHAVALQGTRVPATVIGTVRSFPGMTVNPLVITSYAAFHAASRAAHVRDPLDVATTSVWAKGPPDEVVRALRKAGIDTYYTTTVDDFRRSADVQLATRTYSYLRTIALAAGVLVLVGLLLYLQARQRSQTIASALGRRMGLGRAAETLSLCLEVAGILLFAGVVGAAVAIAAAQPVVRHLDPLPDHPPSPVFVVPSTPILVAAAGLAVLAVAAGVITSWLARRADVSEALRLG